MTDQKDFIDNIKVVSDEEAEEAEYVVCMLEGFPSTFTDNETGPCSKCGRTVIFRPHVPKKPPKICIECLAEELQTRH